MTQIVQRMESPFAFKPLTIRIDKRRSKGFARMNVQELAKITLLRLAENYKVSAWNLIGFNSSAQIKINELSTFLEYEYNGNKETLLEKFESAYDDLENESPKDYYMLFSLEGVITTAKREIAIEKKLHLTTLPTELLIEIMQYLSAEDLAQLEKVNRKFNQLVNTPRFLPEYIEFDYSHAQAITLAEGHISKPRYPILVNDNILSKQDEKANLVKLAPGKKFSLIKEFDAHLGEKLLENQRYILFCL